MRISDWSSDVCSSDLPNPDACAEIGRFLARFHEAVADFPLDRQNGLSLAAWRKLAAQCGDGLAQIAPDLPALVDAQLGALEREWPHSLPSGVIHADLFPDNALRSEEHTSELQSLMRISYAVFCLTKTNNKTTTHSTTSAHTSH